MSGIKLFVKSLRIKIFCICFILHNFTKDSANGKQLKWIQTFSHLLSNDLGAYQLRLYKNTSVLEKFEDLSAFTDNFTQKIPTVKIDLSTVSSSSNYTLLDPEKFLNNGPVIYMHDQNFDLLNYQVMNFLDFYDKSYSKYTKPECLVIIKKRIECFQ